MQQLTSPLLSRAELVGYLIPTLEYKHSYPDIVDRVFQLKAYQVTPSFHICAQTTLLYLHDLIVQVQVNSK